MLDEDLTTLRQEILIGQGMGGIRKEPSKKAEHTARLLKRDVVFAPKRIQDMHFDKINEGQQRYTFLGLKSQDTPEAALTKCPGTHRRFRHSQVMGDFDEPIAGHFPWFEGPEGWQADCAQSHLLPAELEMVQPVVMPYPLTG
jgi:hypothetical protein